MTIPTTVRFDSPLIVHENVMNELFLKVCDPRTMIIVKESYSTKTKSPCKEHYHIYMDCTKNADQCIRNILKKLMPSYQFSPEHKASKCINFGIKYNTEIAKGYLYKSWDREDDYSTKIVYQHHTDTPNITQYLEAYHNSFSKVKQKFNTEMYQIKEWIKTQDVVLGLEVKPSQLCKLVQKYYFEHEKPFHKAHMGQVINHLMYLYNPQDETFTNLLLEEIGHSSMEYENTQKLEEELRMLRRQMKWLLDRQDPE